MLPVTATDIPGMVREFLETVLPNGRTIEVWFKECWPQMLQLTRDEHQPPCVEAMDALGFRLKKPEISSLDMEDEDFEMHVCKLVDTFKNKGDSEEKELVDTMAEHAEWYIAANEQEDFLEQRLWPTLMALKAGTPPNAKHLKELESAIGAGPKEGLDLYTELEWIPEDIRVSPDTSEDIRDFFRHLRSALRAKMLGKPFPPPPKKAAEVKKPEENKP